MISLENLPPRLLGGTCVNNNTAAELIDHRERNNLILSELLQMRREQIKHAKLKGSAATMYNELLQGTFLIPFDETSNYRLTIFEIVSDGFEAMGEPAWSALRLSRSRDIGTLSVGEFDEFQKAIQRKRHILEYQSTYTSHLLMGDILTTSCLFRIRRNPTSTTADWLGPKGWVPVRDAYEKLPLIEQEVTEAKRISEELEDSLIAISSMVLWPVFIESSEDSSAQDSETISLVLIMTSHWSKAWGVWNLHAHLAVESPQDSHSEPEYSTATPSELELRLGHLIQPPQRAVLDATHAVFEAEGLWASRKRHVDCFCTAVGKRLTHKGDSFFNTYINYIFTLAQGINDIETYRRILIAAYGYSIGLDPDALERLEISKSNPDPLLYAIEWLFLGVVIPDPHFADLVNRESIQISQTTRFVPIEEMCASLTTNSPDTKYSVPELEIVAIQTLSKALASRILEGNAIPEELITRLITGLRIAYRMISDKLKILPKMHILDSYANDDLVNALSNIVDARDAAFLAGLCCQTNAAP